MYTESSNLNFELLSKINEVSNVPLVLHGSSGILNEDFATSQLADFWLEVTKIRTASFNVDEQILQLMKIIDADIDGIAISPAHQIYLNDIINKAVASGIFVATFNSDAPGSQRFANIQDDSLTR
jgi:ABC-type sugar transport system substrate-binding protein